MVWNLCTWVLRRRRAGRRCFASATLVRRRRGAGDPDLAAHISVCRARGIALIGPDARDMFEPVPRADYLDSVLGDFDWLRNEEVPAVYAALNACRTLRLMREEGVYSKLECGLWALAQPELPGKGYVARALKAYGMGD